jgi:hypothetical protein
MTTNISVDCHPFLSNKGKQLEVVIETWDNGKLVNTQRGDLGKVFQNICCFEGREIRITELEQQ